MSNATKRSWSVESVEGAVSSTAAGKQRRMDSTEELSFESILRVNYGVLSRCLIVSPVLLANLKSDDYMRTKVTQIRQQTTADSKVTELLNILDEVPDNQQQSVFNTFLSALREDGQEHVANIFEPESDARPMSDEHYQLLVNQQQQLRRCLDPLNGLLDELVTRKVFSDMENSNVMSLDKNSDKCWEVIKIIRRKPDSAFDAFIGALCATKQEHVASLLGHECTEKPMTEEHRQLLSDRRAELSDFINPTCTLLNVLVSVGIFNTRDMDTVRIKSTHADMSTELVNILLRKSDSSFDKFIEALNYTEQPHVVHILTGQGEPPLSRVRRLVLREKRAKLVSRIDSVNTSLLEELISRGVLTDEDKERVEARTVSEDRTAVLIDVIARKSQPAYDQFIDALKDSGHSEVAEELKGLELRGIINPQFLMHKQPAERSRILKIVRNDMEALVSGKGDGIDEFTSLMEQNGFVVSEISEGSIHISFRCFSKESLGNLRRLYTDKTLDKMLTRVFCSAFTEQGLESLTLRLADDEFEKITENLSRLKLATERGDTSPMDSSMPVELLEAVLLRSIFVLFTDDYKSHYKTHEAIRLAYRRYSTLAVVCYNWRQTVKGWPQSTTKHWFRHKVQRALKSMCRPYVVTPRLQLSLSVSDAVSGLTYCHNKLFIVCYKSNSILVFGTNNKQLTNIELKELNIPTDIASCTETQQLFVAGVSRDSRCVWRVSLDDHQVVRWLPNKSTTTSLFRPWTLSVTSGRLLVTSLSKELLLYGDSGYELKRVPLPDMTSLEHAVETSHGTFIVAHGEPQPGISEVNIDGHVMRVYSDQQQLPRPVHLSLDSDDRIFVADGSKRHILLLNNRLELERVLLDKRQLEQTEPRRLCYTQETGQLTVAGLSRLVKSFTVR